MSRALTIAMVLVAGILVPTAGADALPPNDNTSCVVDPLVGRMFCDAQSPGVPVTPRPRTPQPPAKSCTPWEVYMGGNLGINLPPSIGPFTRIGAGGVTETAYTRTCNPGGLETHWFGPPPTIDDLGRQAYSDLRSAQLPAPTAAFAPPVDKMIVNFETWFGVDPVDPVSVTAEVPGLTATATATPVAIELTVNTVWAGTEAFVRCKPWGSMHSKQDGCAWTPKYPSVAKVTGTDDLHYHATIAIVWHVTWSGTGGGGTFADITTSTPIQIGVREIQILGDG